MITGTSGLFSNEKLTIKAWMYAKMSGIKVTLLLN